MPYIGVLYNIFTYNPVKLKSHNFRFQLSDKPKRKTQIENAWVVVPEKKTCPNAKNGLQYNNSRTNKRIVRSYAE